MRAHQAASYRLLELIAELDDEAPRGAWGLKSCAHWLNWRCGIGLNAAMDAHDGEQSGPEPANVTAVTSGPEPENVTAVTPGGENRIAPRRCARDAGGNETGRCDLENGPRLAATGSVEGLRHANRQTGEAVDAAAWIIPSGPLEYGIAIEGLTRRSRPESSRCNDSRLSTEVQTAFTSEQALADMVWGRSRSKVGLQIRNQIS